MSRATGARRVVVDGVLTGGIAVAAGVVAAFGPVWFSSRWSPTTSLLIALLAFLALGRGSDGPMAPAADDGHHAHPLRATPELGAAPLVHGQGHGPPTVPEPVRGEA